jgi:hypothetical protein
VVESAHASASKHTYTKSGNACSVAAMPLGGWEGPRLQESGRRKAGQIREAPAVGNKRCVCARVVSYWASFTGGCWHIDTCADSDSSWSVGNTTLACAKEKTSRV